MRHVLPPADLPARHRRDRQPTAARVVADHPEQGWSLLCNGVVRFDDGGALLPDGTSIPALVTSPAPANRYAAQSVAVAA